MRKARFVIASVASGLIAAVWGVPASAAPIPVTYLNANFGTNFYRSSGTLQLASPTASVLAQARRSEVDFSASANSDPNETSSGFSTYNVGTVNAGPGSMNGVTVTPRTLQLSGTASFAMNLWFDSDHNGEYFVWDHNRFAGLGGDVYAIGTSNNGTLTINQNTPLFLIPNCTSGVNVTTLAVINSGGCTSIPPNTNAARWVGIDIPMLTSGGGKAAV